MALFSEYILMTSVLFISHSSSSIGQVLLSLNESKQLQIIVFFERKHSQHKAFIKCQMYTAKVAQKHFWSGI